MSDSYIRENPHTLVKGVIRSCCMPPVGSQVSYMLRARRRFGLVVEVNHGSVDVVPLDDLLAIPFRVEQGVLHATSFVGCHAVKVPQVNSLVDFEMEV